MKVLYKLTPFVVIVGMIVAATYTVQHPRNFAFVTVVQHPVMTVILGALMMAFISGKYKLPADQVTWGNIVSMFSMAMGASITGIGMMACIVIFAPH